MLLNIVDVEATCWRGAPPDGQTNEIIEIGVCVLDLVRLEALPARSILVRPSNSEISAFCTELTGWTSKDVQAGVPFEIACAGLSRESDSANRPWASWGDYDRKQFERECLAKSVSYPFSGTHTNLKKLHARLRNQGKQVSMANALHLSGLELQGRHHRGADDAANIARILLAMIGDCGKDAVMKGLSLQ